MVIAIANLIYLVVFDFSSLYIHNAKVWYYHESVILPVAFV